MCLISVAWRSSQEQPFVFAGNRDEYHARESTAADWWEDAPDVLGGRDLVAGGSWLGINRNGRFAVVTNRPDIPAPEQNALSRGALVSERLRPAANSAELDRQLHLDAQCYGGFSLLTGSVSPGSTAEMNCHSGGNGITRLNHQNLQPGIFGLSNTATDDPWPKLTWLNREIEQMVANQRQPAADELFTLLLRREPVPNADSDGVSARPFIVGEDYGTRCATVIIVNRDGQCQFIERRFGPGGIADGVASFEFSLS